MCNFVLECITGCIWMQKEIQTIAIIVALLLFEYVKQQQQ